MDHGTLKYVAAAGADNVICAGKALLIGIIFGADVGSAVVEVSDHPSDGDGNIQLYFSGSTLATSIGYVLVNAVFNNGICSDIANQTHVTFIFKPL